MPVQNREDQGFDPAPTREPVCRVGRDETINKRGDLQARHWFRLMSCANEQYVWTLQPYRVMILPRETSFSSGGEHGIGADSMYRLWWSERQWL